LPLGSPGDGVYTNQFLAVQVASAAEFSARAAELVKLWNAFNMAAEPSTGLLFEMQPVEIGGRAATRCTLDIAAAEGTPDIPEIRQLMERLFGPERKMQVFIVPIDETTVLLAIATAEQTAQEIQAIAARDSTNWNDPAIATVNELLPRESDWRVFFSPAAYSTWGAREIGATLGDVIGMPKPRVISASPAVGLSGGVNGRELWIDAVVPAQTLHASGAAWSGE
jgi:hypothetical protein